MRSRHDVILFASLRTRVHAIERFRMFMPNGKRQKYHMTMFICIYHSLFSVFSVKLSSFALASNVKIILHYSHLCSNVLKSASVIWRTCLYIRVNIIFRGSLGSGKIKFPYLIVHVGWHHRWRHKPRSRASLWYRGFIWDQVAISENQRWNCYDAIGTVNNSDEVAQFCTYRILAFNHAFNELQACKIYIKWMKKYVYHITVKRNGRFALMLGWIKSKLKSIQF